MNWSRFVPPFLRKASGGDGTLDLFREIMALGAMSKTGENVTWESALKCATALACGRVIASGIAQVPFKLFREEQGGKKRIAKEHKLYRVLHLRANQWQTSFEFRETVALHLVFCGRAYAYKVKVAGQIRELIPFEPNKVRTQPFDDGTLRYFVTGRDGREREFAAADIWHLKGMSWSGTEGLDAIKMAREAIGLAIATEAHHSKMHSSSIQPSGVYSVEGTLDPEQHKKLRKFLKDNYAGENSGLPMVLDRGAKWLQLAMTGVDAQHLETRRYQVEEMCRSMGVMPIMVFSSDKTATFASAEAMYAAHVVHTLASWWTRIEQSADCNLLTEREVEQGYYTRFIGAGLLRGSMKDRAEYFAKALGAGGSPAWMTQDEVRSLEELDPMGGDAAVLPKPTNVAKPAAVPIPEPEIEPVGA